MHNKWIKTQTRNIYRKINPNSNPNDAIYKTLEHEFIDNLRADEIEHNITYFNGLTSDKDEWNFINEARNAKRTETTESSFKKCFKLMT